MSEIKTREIEGRTFELRPARRSYFGSYGVDVFETTNGLERHLNEGVDAAVEPLADEVILALASRRRQDLVAVMRYYTIVAGVDYKYEDDYDLLYSTEPVGPYVVVSGDETYHWIDVVETREAAAASVRGDIMGWWNNGYPHHPLEIRELDTGHSIPFKVEVSVELLA